MTRACRTSSRAARFARRTRRCGAPARASSPASLRKETTLAPSSSAARAKKRPTEGAPAASGWATSPSGRRPIAHGSAGSDFRATGVTVPSVATFTETSSSTKQFA
ncbi:MAG: hypothetical protein IPQ09_08885 [Myxococcales bacterium]|nr:hypothetical protein [Myxococcales bacterium]